MNGMRWIKDTIYMGKLRLKSTRLNAFNSCIDRHMNAVSIGFVLFLLGMLVGSL